MFGVRHRAVVVRADCVERLALQKWNSDLSCPDIHFQTLGGYKP